MISTISSYILSHPYTAIAGCIGISTAFHAVADYNRESNNICPRHVRGVGIEIYNMSLYDENSGKPLVYPIYKSTYPELVYLNEILLQTAYDELNGDYSKANKVSAYKKALVTHSDLEKNIIRRLLIRRGRVGKYLIYLLQDKFFSVIVLSTFFVLITNILLF